MDRHLIQRNKATVATFLAGTHSVDPDGLSVIDETVADGIVGHGFPGFPGGGFRGREPYKAFFRNFRTSFDQMRFRTLAMIATDDYVSAHWQAWATHSGPFRGIEADGRRVVFDGVALYRMERGLIAECWLTINESLLLSQLGRRRARAA